LWLACLPLSSDTTSTAGCSPLVSFSCKIRGEEARGSECGARGIWFGARGAECRGCGA
jgi:hypothetical protein